MVAQHESRHHRPLDGPWQLRESDIGPLNTLFSEAFSERYRRDGLVGVRVPPLNPMIWRYAIDDAGEGAMLWRDDRGTIAAFNIAHRSGTEGWMGPLAVRDDRQGTGAGKAIVRAGIAHLHRAGCRIIGLETMPRTMDNIGFYAGLGFAPGRLTLTMTLEGARAEQGPRLLSSLSSSDRSDALRECATLVDGLIRGYDYTREIELTRELGIGDTLLLYEADALTGFALCHSAPLVEGRAKEELRVLKLVLRDHHSLDAMLLALADFARRSGTSRVAVRVQGEYSAMLRRLMAMGARVRWTDLRMTLEGSREKVPTDGIVISNWEI